MGLAALGPPYTFYNQRPQKDKVNRAKPLCDPLPRPDNRDVVRRPLPSRRAGAGRRPSRQALGLSRHLHPGPQQRHLSYAIGPQPRHARARQRRGRSGQPLVLGRSAQGHVPLRRRRTQQVGRQAGRGHQRLRHRSGRRQADAIESAIDQGRRHCHLAIDRNGKYVVVAN